MKWTHSGSLCLKRVVSLWLITQSSTFFDYFSSFFSTFRRLCDKKLRYRLSLPKGKIDLSPNVCARQPEWEWDSRHPFSPLRRHLSPQVGPCSCFVPGYETVLHQLSPTFCVAQLAIANFIFRRRKLWKVSGRERGHSKGISLRDFVWWFSFRNHEQDFCGVRASLQVERENRNLGSPFTPCFVSAITGAFTFCGESKAWSEELQDKRDTVQSGATYPTDLGISLGFLQTMETVLFRLTWARIMRTCLAFPVRLNWNDQTGVPAWHSKTNEAILLPCQWKYWHRAKNRLRD